MLFDYRKFSGTPNCILSALQIFAEGSQQKNTKNYHSQFQDSVSKTCVGLCIDELYDLYSNFKIWRTNLEKTIAFSHWHENSISPQN